MSQAARFEALRGETCKPPPVPFVFTNNLDVNSPRASDIPVEARVTANSWEAGSTVTVDDDDFVTLDDSGMLGPRGSDGSLPVTGFARLVASSDLIDAGSAEGAAWYLGAAPDLGCFETR